MTISAARRSAFEILRRVEEESAFASVLLAGLNEQMREDDRALAYELVMGVLQRRLWLDRAIEHFANRKIEKLDLAVRLALEIALYQLRFLTRVPQSAAVNESVNIVRAAGVKSAANFVNAVLRNATREREYDPTTVISDDFEKLSVETSHPAWLIEQWSAAFGFEEAAMFARANNEVPPMSFRLTRRAAPTKQPVANILKLIEERGGHLSPSEVVSGALRVRGASKVVRKLAGDGLVYLQDEASQLVSHVLNAQSNERVLDIAAAPGSKATHIAMLAPNARVIAGDLYAHRVATMRRLATAQGAKIHVLVHDAMAGLPFAPESFDRVLLDAPCSGTGTLRGNPEIRYRLKPEDLLELSSTQSRMLANAAGTVRPGGRLVYSTCSVEIDENETVIDQFLAQHKDFVRINIDAAAGLKTESGDVRTWPHRQGTDGFYVAALEKNHAA
jgi:16S rRNA (cytosine967-C5)-methyltransferase